MTSAIAAAIALAGAHGVRVDAGDAVVMKDGANVVVHLAPAPLVARVASVTVAVRDDPSAFLARDVAVAQHASSRGAAVTPPSRDVPPGPHDHDGLVVTFWEYVAHERGREPSPEELGRALRDLHGALADYDGIALPYLGPVLGELDTVIDRLHHAGALDATTTQRFRDDLASCAAALPAPGGADRALHGDAHGRNALATAAGVVWADFEDACTGSVAWDLVVLARRAGPAALAAYGDDRPSDAELAPYLAARALQGAVWEEVFAARDRGLIHGVPVG